MRTRLPLATQILAFQVGIIMLAALLGGVAAVWQAARELDRQYEQRSLVIAQSVASMAPVQQALLVGDRSGAVQAAAEQIRQSTGATYVVVTDRSGIRYSHPNPALIGQKVDEDPGAVLRGSTWVGVQRGTLGVSARGKAPIRVDAQVIGMVSVGYLETEVVQQLIAELPGYVAIVLLALGLGAAGSFLLARWLKRQTFGLEPYQIAGLLEEREASLYGIHEGAIATDGEGRITIVNDQARRLLELPSDAAGKKLSQVVPSGRLLEFLSGRLHDQDEILLVGERVLVASRRPVKLHARVIGHVVTLRDSTELRTLSGGLGIDSLTDALRAQAHEFSNRLHVIAGLVELGRGEEAMRLINEVSGVHQDLSEALLHRMGDPVLGALLLAKAAIASERGIELQVSEDTVLSKSPLDPNDLITLLGNLIDNALDAAAQSTGKRRVDVSVVMEEDDLVIRVADSGPGVPNDLLDRIFTEGFTTKSRSNGRRRGFGLTLVSEVARRNGGQVAVGSDSGGAVFTVRLPVRRAVPA
jgi:two-component system, CitB family, sensor kinase